MKTILLLLTIFSLIDTSNVNEFKTHEIKVEQINYTHGIIQGYDDNKIILIHGKKQTNKECEVLKCLDFKGSYNLLIPGDTFSIDLKTYSYKGINYGIYFYKQ